MWRNDDCPCTQDCPDRDPYCHGSCKKYEAWVVKRAEAKKARAIYMERYKVTNAQKKAIWLAKRRDNYHAYKKF